MKKVKALYEFDGKVRDAVTISSLEEYEASNKGFLHNPKTVIELLKKGATIVINQKGGWCVEGSAVKVVEG